MQPERYTVKSQEVKDFVRRMRLFVEGKWRKHLKRNDMWHSVYTWNGRTMGQAHTKRRTEGSGDYDLLIANISLTEERRGRGFLTAVLDLLEPEMNVQFEMVLNPDLRRMLYRRGYQPIGERSINLIRYKEGNSDGL